ncbi:SDR family NAD(P)-dependent oxidoreductase [Rhodopseudomonas boonkerdii]|uniref:SDR family NAD(P)-dependent oxidoreductase n=1 Tax=Rhodopseudomonas boonkerdii TaxID=475937 RepID=UPI001E3C0875|nr:SDR family NAD(P)-dependent oxidoreductase [Rhodopseudomonas boonkerdii]
MMGVASGSAVLASRDLNEATVIVTGGGSGIGRAIVDAVVASGNLAVAWDINEESLASCRAQHGDAVLTACVDVSDYNGVAEAMSRLSGKWSPTHLVNNAGIIGRRMMLAEMDPAEIDRVLSINLKSAIYCTRSFLTHRRSHASSAIVNLASIAARTGGMPGNALYATTKGAIVSLTIASAKELAPAVRVNALAPGVIDTPIQGDVFDDPTKVAEIAKVIPAKRAGSVEEVAAAAIWLLSPAASYVTATVLDVAGGR